MMLSSENKGSKCGSSGSLFLYGFMLNKTLEYLKEKHRHKAGNLFSPLVKRGRFGHSVEINHLESNNSNVRGDLIVSGRAT